MINFLTKTFIKRTELGQRQSITHEGYVVHCYVRSDGLGGAVTTDMEYPARVAFVLLGQLLEEYSGKYENFKVVESTFSQRGRRGIASVPPMDANSQDVSVLIGSEDISKLDRYSEDDPRVLNLTGAFNIGNRGI